MKSTNFFIPAILLCQILSFLLIGCDQLSSSLSDHIFACNYYFDINEDDHCAFNEYFGRKNTFKSSEQITFVLYNFEVKKGNIGPGSKGYISG
jgi:hypothetical protein